MTYCLRLISVTFVLIAGMLAFLAAPGEGAENYTSYNSSDPKEFDNPSNDAYFDTSDMDVVSFGGKEVVFFTMDTDTGYSHYLYFYMRDPNDTANAEYNSYIDLHTPYAGTVKFKAVVFNNVLYIFYTSIDSTHFSRNTVYYRTANVDYGGDGKWKLAFGEQKALPAGTSYARLRLATVMNGKLYVIYTDYTYDYEYGYHDGNNWYYISSDDGLTFSEGSFFFTSIACPTGWRAHGSVFSAPDGTGGWKEILMLAYATGGSNLYYFFFDGDSPGYSHKSLATGLSNVGSVRLFTGTADGYTNDKFVMQVFLTTPAGSNYMWSYIYHGQYTLSGPAGDSGTWTPWTRLSKSDNDHVWGRTSDVYYEPLWAVNGFYSNELNSSSGFYDLRTNLRVWYSRHSSYSTGDQIINFRHSDYLSDVLVAQERLTPPVLSDLSTATIVGVIEGPPPFPINAGLPTAIGEKVSTVDLMYSAEYSFSTAWTAEAATTLSYGKKFSETRGFLAKLSAGLKEGRETSDKYSVTQTISLFSYRDTYSKGGIGWVVVLKPQILNDPYILRSYDRNVLNYDGLTDEFEMSVITYGPQTALETYEYFLTEPTTNYGSGTYASAFAGMAPRHLSTDVEYWSAKVIPTDTYDIFTIMDAYNKPVNPLPFFKGDPTSQVHTEIKEGTVDVASASASAGFSVDAKALGFEVEGSIKYTMDIKTTTSLTKSLGFWYTVPQCPPYPQCCVSDVEINTYILVPKDGAPGYDAPWVSDDIRTFQKPKPWSLTYMATAPNYCTGTTLNATKIELQKAEGAFFMDKGELNRDRISAKLRLNVPPDFLMSADEWVHLRFGNHITDTGNIDVLSREFDGKNLVIALKGPTPKSTITLKLSYDDRKSTLDIDLNADRISLAELFYHYPSLNASGKDTVQLGLYLGGKYHAATDLDVHCAANDQNAICNFHSKK